MSTDLASIGRELAGAAVASKGDPMSFHERVLRAAAKQAESASLIVAALAEHDHALRVEQCARRCRCPHDFGEHLAEAPHRCDAVDVEVGDDGQERVSPCPCPGFELAPPIRTDTVPASAIAPTTTPAPPPVMTPSLRLVESGS